MGLSKSVDFLVISAGNHGSLSARRLTDRLSGCGKQTKGHNLVIDTAIASQPVAETEIGSGCRHVRRFPVFNNLHDNHAHFADEVPAPLRSGNFVMGGFHPGTNSPSSRNQRAQQTITYEEFMREDTGNGY